MAITIQVEGKEYEGFTSAEVFTTLDTISGSFSFETTTLGTDVFPIQVGQECIVKVEGFTVLTGFVEVIVPSYDAESHSIQIQGRDKTADVIDSSIIEGFEKNSNNLMTLKSVIETILEQNNITDIKVINDVDDIEDFKVGEITSSGVGENMFDFLAKNARSKRVFLITDGLGNIVISRSQGVSVNEEILNIVDNPRSNTLSGSARYDYTNRFRTYRLDSQLNTTAVSFLGAEVTNKNIVSPVNFASDEDIRESRNLLITPDFSMDSGDLGKMAQWEANIRRIDSLQYTCQVQGHLRQDADEIWMPDQIVKVQDDFAGIDDILLVNSCRYTFNNKEGARTKLSFVDQDAYKEQAEKPIAEQKSSTFGSLFIKQ